MDIPPIGELELAAKKLVWAAQKQGNLQDFTPRLIRQAIEKQFKLEEGTLDASEFKSALKAATKYAVDNDPPDQDQDKPKVSPQRKTKRKSDGKIKAEAKEESLPKPKSTPKAKGKAEAKATASDDEESDAPTPKKKRKVVPVAKKNMSDEEEEDYKGEDTSPKTKRKIIKPKKKIVSDDEEQAEAPRSTSSKPRTKQGRDSKAYKSAEHVPTSDMEQDESDTVEAHKPIETKKQPTSPTIPKRGNAQPEISKSANIEVQDAAAKSESELSILIDEPPKPKRKKLTTGEKASMKPSEKSKSKKTAKSSVALSKDEETIKRLKSLVVACGTRKVWSKVFQSLDTPQQQIKKLREILTELGMTGRMSMEQAKAIKEKRELEKELADVKEFAEKMEGRASRSRGNTATTKMDIDVEGSAKEEESSEDEEVEAPKKRSMNARKSIMAFLGNQSDED